MPKNSRGFGFTLVEVLIAVGIIGAIVTAFIVILNPSKQIGKANDARRKSDIKTIQSALEQFRADNGAYPKFFVTSSGIYTYGWAKAKSLAFDTNPITLAKPDISYIKEFPLGPNVKSEDPCTSSTNLSFRYYGYVYGGNENIYTIFTNLQNEDDPDALAVKPAPVFCPQNQADPTQCLTDGGRKAQFFVGSCKNIPGGSNTYNYWVNSP